MKKRNERILSILARDAFPDGRLGRICMTSVDSFFDKRKEKSGWKIKTDETKSVKGWSERYAFKDNGGSVLAVAHCDTVMDGKYPYIFDVLSMHVMSPELDDRLGVYVITNLLPRLGVKCDVLLTDNEESCASTASQFTTDKKYNWIFEFDRRGTGCVMYQYETPELKGIMEAYGFKVSMGTYSDIADLHSLKVVGINFATGYANEHTQKCFADLRCLSKQVAKFVKFYDDKKDELMTSNAGARFASRWGYYDYDWEDREGFFDKDGKWHYGYNSNSAIVIPNQTSATSSSNPLVMSVCDSCGKTSAFPSKYLLRGRYLCLSCEVKCNTCHRLYSFEQMYDDDTCWRCQLMYEAYEGDGSVKCYSCGKQTFCTEIATDTFICADCIANRFVVCDTCKEVMPAGKIAQKIAPNYPAGQCVTCERLTAEYLKTHKQNTGKSSRSKCEGCNMYYSWEKVVYSSTYRMRLCPSCVNEFNRVEDEAEDEMNKELDKVDEDEVVAYSECDVCSSREQLYEKDDLKLCKTCKDRMSKPGI